MENLETTPRERRVPLGFARSMAGAGGEDDHHCAHAYEYVRGRTIDLCHSLEIEDYVIQSMPDVSPAKWHLAHTTWFFETFILIPEMPEYRVFHRDFEYLFNSYYNAVGPQFSRPRRGLLSRPTVREIRAYRDHVDQAMNRYLTRSETLDPAIHDRVVLGLHHEQQHQELMFMDIKHVFSCNPLYPALRANAAPAAPQPAPALRWYTGPSGVHRIGRDATAGFCFDNECPRHDVVIHPFELASRCVTNAEYLEFMADGGYQRSDFWLSDGWAMVQAENWRAPLYWYPQDELGGEAGDKSAAQTTWYHLTLGGMKPVDPHAPVVHVSHYEADAFARWAGARLPTEFEWESMTDGLTPDSGNFAHTGHLHPMVAEPNTGGRPSQMFGDVWEWTASAYLPYPGYRPAPGAIGEYNGKFMSGQMVLRGGCCATSEAHIRATYRNFFPPSARWPFAGIRLARTL